MLKAFGIVSNDVGIWGYDGYVDGNKITARTVKTE